MSPEPSAQPSDEAQLTLDVFPTAADRAAQTFDRIAATLRNDPIPPSARLRLSYEASMTTGRPGNGGRRPGRTRGNVAGVRNALEATWGPPVFRDASRTHEVAIYRASADDVGDGMICARLSSSDINKGETVKIQIDQGLEFCAAKGLTPRYVCATLRADRNVEYEDRLDFELIRTLHERGHINWLTWRKLERIGRDLSTATRFVKDMSKSGLMLYGTEKAKVIRWDLDKTEIMLEGFVAESEADGIRRRVLDGIERRIAIPGRPLYASIPFGFWVTDDGFLAVDHDQFEIVREIFRLYLEDPSDGPPMSFAAISRHLAKRGIDLHEKSISNILADRRYVTGIVTCSYAHMQWDARPIEGFVGIPEAWLDEADRRRDTRGGKDTVTPVGQFCLNAIQLVHAPCHLVHNQARERDEDAGLPPRLSAYIKKTRLHIGWQDSCYTHSRGRKNECRSLAIHAPTLERAVIEQLHKFADDPRLQEAWIKRARPTDELPNEMAVQPDEFLARLRTDKKRLEGELGAALRDYQNEAGRVRTSSREAWAVMIGSLQTEISRLDEQITHATRRAAAALPKQTKSSQAVDEFKAILTFEPPEDPDKLRARVNLLKACLSKVVVHDEEDGYTIELEGPLVPSDTPLRTGLPWDKVPSRGSLGGDFVPTWRSDRVQLVVPSSWPYETVSAALDELRWLHENLPPGSLGVAAATGASSLGLGTDIKRRSKLPDLQVVQFQLRLPWRSLVLAAISIEEAAACRRYQWLDLEMVLVILQLGVRLRDPLSFPGGQVWWEAVRAENPSLPWWSNLCGFLRRRGLSGRELSLMAASGQVLVEDTELACLLAEEEAARAAAWVGMPPLARCARPAVEAKLVERRPSDADVRLYDAYVDERGSLEARAAELGLSRDQLLRQGRAVGSRLGWPLRSHVRVLEVSEDVGDVLAALEAGRTVSRAALETGRSEQVVREVACSAGIDCGPVFGTGVGLRALSGAEVLGAEAYLLGALMSDGANTGQALVLGTARGTCTDVEEQMAWLRGLVAELGAAAVIKRGGSGRPTAWFADTAGCRRAAELGVRTSRRQWLDARFDESLVGRAELWRGLLEGAARVEDCGRSGRRMRIRSYPGVLDQLDVFVGDVGASRAVVPNSTSRREWRVYEPGLAVLVAGVWGSEQPRRPRVAAWLGDLRQG